MPHILFMEFFSHPSIISVNKPDITLLDFYNKQMFVTEFSYATEKNISRKDEEKSSKYLDLLSKLMTLGTKFY